MESSGGCFGRLFGGGEKKKQVQVDLQKNRSDKVESHSLIPASSGVAIRQTLHFAAIASLVNNNDGQHVHIVLRGVTGTIIQCAAPAAAAGVDHVVDSAEVVPTTTIATVDVHQEEGHGKKKKRSSSSSSLSSASSKSSKSSSSKDAKSEDPHLNYELEPELVVSDAVAEPELIEGDAVPLDIEPVEPTLDIIEDSVVPSEEPECQDDAAVTQDVTEEECGAVVETESAEVVAEEVVPEDSESAAEIVVEDEEIIVCEESPEVFCEPPISTMDAPEDDISIEQSTPSEEDVIVVEGVVTVESTPDEEPEIIADEITADEIVSVESCPTEEHPISSEEVLLVESTPDDEHEITSEEIVSVESTPVESEAVPASEIDVTESTEVDADEGEAPQEKKKKKKKTAEGEVSAEGGEKKKKKKKSE